MARDLGVGETQSSRRASSTRLIRGPIVLLLVLMVGASVGARLHALKGNVADHDPSPGGEAAMGQMAEQRHLVLQAELVQHITGDDAIVGASQRGQPLTSLYSHSHTMQAIPALP